MGYTFAQLTEKSLERSIKHWGMNEKHWDVMQWGCATAGEVGEACNIAKKIARVRQGIRDDLIPKKYIRNPNRHWWSPWRPKMVPRYVPPKEYEWDLRDKLAGEMCDSILYFVLWAASEKIDLDEWLPKVFNAKSKEIGSDIML